MTDPHPYLRLWTAVVVQAVSDACYPNPHRREAQDWIRGPIFGELCEVLDLNSGTIRAQIDSPHVYESMRYACRKRVKRNA